MQRVGRRLRELPVSAWIALAFLSFVLALSIGVPQLPSFDPFSQDLGAAKQGPLFTNREGTTFLLGTDAFGRDLLSRLALAGRISLLMAASAVAISLVIGTTLGLIAGYRGGRWDALISTACDIQLSVPRFVLLIAVIALFGSSLTNLAITLGLTGWVAYARVTRSQTMSIREREYVQAARLIGATPRRILTKHILPNQFVATVILASFDIGQVMIVEASLSFIGLGVQPPLPAWGSMVREGEAYLRSTPHLMILPGLAIFMVVAGVNFLTQQFTSERSRMGMPVSTS